MSDSTRGCDSRGPRAGRKWSATCWLAAWTVVGAYFASSALPGPSAREALASARPIAATPPPAASPRSKNIEDIVPGDVVLARDEATGRVAPKRVVRLFPKTADHIRHLRFRSQSGGVQEIQTTDDHPFWVIGSRWVDAGKLEVGQPVEQDDGGAATVVSSRRVPHPEGVPVYNFEVEDFHTYFVSQRPGDAPVLVHNLPCTKTYQTYTKTNPLTGEVYSGRTSGTGTPLQNIARRDASHHRTGEGFGKAVLDQSSTNKSAIRGREQMLIDKSRTQGTAADQINGISDRNPKRTGYLKAARKAFGDP